MVNNDWVIRHPVVDDAAGVAYVHTTGWREAYGDLISERFYDDDVLASRTTGWERLLANPDYVERTYVAELHSDSASRIVGIANCGQARDDDSPVAEELTTIYILSEVYGSGIGQALLDAVLADRPAMLWVAKENPRARRFYEKNGFAPDGRDRIEVDCDNLEEIRMVRR